MTRLRSALLVGCIALGAGIACSEFAAEGGGATDPAPTDDAGRDGADGEGGGGEDGDVPPLPLPTDAGVDAALLPKTAFDVLDYGTNFDDFEGPGRPQNGPLGWTAVNDGAVLPVSGPCTDTTSCSSDYTAIFRIEEGSGPPGAVRSFLVAALLPRTRVLRLDFSMQIGHAAGVPIGQAQLASVELKRSEVEPSNRFIYLETRADRLRLGDQFLKSDGFFDSEEIDIGDLAINTKGVGPWEKYRLYIDFTRGLAGVWRDGTVLAVKKLREPIYAAPLLLTSMRIGPTFTDGTSAFSVAYDDVGKHETE